MIVDLHLLTHPKFLMLEQHVGEAALKYLLRLWGHCQANQRGGNWGRVTNEYVEAVCEWKGERGQLYKALLDPYGTGKSGWIKRHRRELIIHEWDEKNASLLSCWRNGRRGGRRKSRDAGPKSDSDATKPTANPAVTRSEGSGTEENKKRESESSPTETLFISASEAEKQGVPTLAEVEEYGKAKQIPRDFCEHYFEKKHIAQSWRTRRGQFVDWGRELCHWWKNDRPTWGKRKLKLTRQQIQEKIDSILSVVGQETDEQQIRAMRAELQELEEARAS